MATRLYIIRHALAGQHGDPNFPDDSQRPLTNEGRKQFKRLMKKLVKRGLAPTHVATSPYVRCRQTAELICDRLDVEPTLVDLPALEPGSKLDDVISWTREQKATELAWVGHAPDVDEMAAALIGGPRAQITFAKGAVAAIEFAGDVKLGEGQLIWLVTPKLIRG